jgi:predicted ferric reductase
MWDLQASIAFLLLILVAMPWIRWLSYELSIQAHLLLGIFMAVMVWMHMDRQSGFNAVCLMVAAILLALNSAMHALKFALRNLVAGQPLALAEVVKHKGAVELTIRPARPWKVRPGQYIYIRAPGVRPLSFAESHPFALMWWEDGPDGKAVTISVLAKIESGFTRALSTIPHKQLRVLIDGPYGQCKDINDYDYVIMIATGIGIATQLPYAKGFLRRRVAEQKAAAAKGLGMRQQRISLVWELEEEC